VTGGGRGQRRWKGAGKTGETMKTKEGDLEAREKEFV